MDEDPIAIALRRDAEMLIGLAPEPNAALLWQKVQRARARRLQRIMNLCGWSLRAAVAMVLAGVALKAPGSLIEVILPLALVAWLSRGICSPISAKAPPAGAMRSMGASTGY